MTTVDELAVISYGDFGRRFFELAVTEARVARAVESVAGQPVEFGPLGVGPMGLVKVQAHGTVGQPTVARREAELIEYAVDIPVDLRLQIDIGLERARFTADVVVHLGVTARAAAPLLIVIDVQPPTKDEVDVVLRAEGRRASVLQAVGGVEGEVKRSVAKVVRKQIENPTALQARIIDVANALEKIGRS